MYIELYLVIIIILLSIDWQASDNDNTTKTTEVSRAFNEGGEIWKLQRVAKENANPWGFELRWLFLHW